MSEAKCKCCVSEALIATSQKGKQGMEMLGRLMTGSEDSTVSGAAE